MSRRCWIATRCRCAASGFDIAAGLWLPAGAVAEIVDSPAALDALADDLQRRDIVCYTLNAFPFGDFHSERVKENVYLPDWSDPRRLEYTTRCARVLARILGDRAEGSISTLPLGFKGFAHPPGFLDAALGRLLTLARNLDGIRRDSGKCIRLALEPEPFCLFETTAETVAFFERLFATAEREGLGDIARRHLGVCYDVCHQAVEFEDAAAAIGALDAAGIRINKVQVSCAIEIEDPDDAARRKGAVAIRRAAILASDHGTIGRRLDRAFGRLDGVVPAATFGRFPGRWPPGASISTFPWTPDGSVRYTPRARNWSVR